MILFRKDYFTLRKKISNFYFSQYCEIIISWGSFEYGLVKFIKEYFGIINGLYLNITILVPSMHTIKKSFWIRHKILQELNQLNEGRAVNDIQPIGSVKISSNTGLSTADIHNWGYLLVEDGDVAISDRDGQMMFSLLQSGRSAFIDKKYLKAGRQDVADRIWNYARFVIPALILITSVVSITYNASLADKLKTFEGRLKVVEDTVNKTVSKPKIQK